MLGERAGLIVTLLLGAGIVFLAAWGAAGFLEGWGLHSAALWVKGGALLLIGLGPIAALWTLQHPDAARPTSTAHAYAGAPATATCPHCHRPLTPAHAEE